MAHSLPELTAMQHNMHSSLTYAVSCPYQSALTSLSSVTRHDSQYPVGGHVVALLPALLGAVVLVTTNKVPEFLCTQRELNSTWGMLGG